MSAIRPPEDRDRELTAIIVHALTVAGVDVVKTKNTAYNEGIAATLALAMAMRDVRNARSQ